MKARPFTVFLCSTYIDLVEERDAVAEVLKHLKFQYGSMEYFGARPNRSIETCLEEVRESDIVVVIVGYRYGSIVEDYQKSFTELEYEEAWKNGKHCLVYFRSDNVPILPSKMERNPIGIQSLDNFKELLLKRHTVAIFENPRNLAASVAADLGRTIAFIDEHPKGLDINKVFEVFDFLKTPFLVISKDNQIRSANDTMASALEYSTEELVGKDFSSLIAPEFPSGSTIWDEAQAGRQTSFFKLLLKSGIRKYFEFDLSQHQLIDGAVLQCIARDVTERKSVEEEREHLIMELESKNAELERFTYTVSHDLRSPLVTIRGFLGYMQEDFNNGNVDRFEKDLERVTTAIDKMQNILRDLLELSRIGRVMNPPENISLADVINEALGSHIEQIQKYNIKIEIVTPLAKVFGDYPRLREVYENLIENSIKFRGNVAKPTIEIGTEKNEDEITCWVRDNGIGIQPLYHNRIFSLFNKLDAITEGTGVGLSIVKRIVETHGGKIWVESSGDATGSTFFFTLPIAKEHNI